MGWRSVLVSKPARLSVKNRQLLLEQDQGITATLPLEDLSVVVLDTPHTLLTGALLSELADRVSQGDLSAPDFPGRSGDEIGVLAQSFSRMRTSVVQAMKMLES